MASKLPRHRQDTIFAPATPPGISAIALIRISGPETFHVIRKIFKPAKADVIDKIDGSSQIIYGSIRYDNELIDRVLLSIFKAPHSYSGEDIAEISCHGSAYILRRISEILSKLGLRLAEPGEFTLRAFLSGKINLAQSEAVADLISAHSAASHSLAINQMRSGFTNEIARLRSKLLEFTALIELELDFSEENVEFADRVQLNDLIDGMASRLASLIKTFSYGNAIRQGVPTTIIGRPNTGKSTLLNQLLQENRAIVSETPGTTRDYIEDTMVIDGIEFRIQDTAGIRNPLDGIEAEGVSRSLELARSAALIICLFDPREETIVDVKTNLLSQGLREDTAVIYAANKSDLLETVPPDKSEVLYISAKFGKGIEGLKSRMSAEVGMMLEKEEGQVIISDLRHLTALSNVQGSLYEVKQGLVSEIGGELLAIHLKDALYELGTITGEITSEEVLSSIFGRFCIGK